MTSQILSERSTVTITIIRSRPCIRVNPLSSRAEYAWFKNIWRHSLTDEDKIKTSLVNSVLTLNSRFLFTFNTRCFGFTVNVTLWYSSGKRSRRQITFLWSHSPCIFFLIIFGWHNGFFPFVRRRIQIYMKIMIS